LGFGAWNLEFILRYSEKRTRPPVARRAGLNFSGRVSRD
jgi:hypothetical protein